jgi:glycosyltransferase involved in cell wall biosynthesis
MNLLLQLTTQHNGKPAGVARYADNLVAVLQEMKPDWRISALTSYRLGSLNDSVVKIIDRPRFIVWDALVAGPVRLLKYFKSSEPDYIVNLDPYAPILMGKGNKTIVIVHDLYFRSTPDVCGTVELLTSHLIYKRLARSGCKFLCVSNYSAKVLADSYPEISANRIGVIGSAPATSAGSRALTEAAAEAVCTEKKFDFSYFLLVGNNTKNKDFSTAYHAYARFQISANSKTKLVHVGPSADEVEKLARDAGVDNSQIVCKQGISDAELVSLYQRAIALVVSSRDEGFCLPVVEAQSQGCLVIHADIPILREVAGVHGYPYPASDVDALTQKMLAAFELTSNQADVALNKKAAMAHASGFSWDRVAAKLIGFLK